MSARDYTALALLPVVIDAPGAYLTRMGDLVNLTQASARNAYACRGTYSCGTPDAWHPSGRLYAGMPCGNDIVCKAFVTPPRARLARFLWTHRRLSACALRAVLAGDDQALTGQAEQHRYVLSEIERMRANIAGATP